MAIHFLFLFMDGVGLGANDPLVNPLARADMPHLRGLLDGNRLVAGVAPLESERATLLALDANLGVDGLPQSATGQATILTGKNVPALVGEHYGPKPHKPVRELIAQGSLFSTLRERGYTAALLNAYPQRYFEAIDSGHRMYSAIPLAVTSAGIPLKTTEDYYAGQALSADFTGQGWRDFLGYDDAPLMTPHQAGRRLAELATSYDFAFFEYWPSDFAGHRQDKSAAVDLLETFDKVLGGLLEDWEDQSGLVLITSDHGNLEDLSTRRHTTNPVPGLLIGAPELRARIAPRLRALSDLAPAILDFFPT